MRILITGHNGWIGKHVYNALEKSHDVLGYDVPVIPTFESWKQKLNMCPSRSSVLGTQFACSRLLYFLQGIDFVLLLIFRK